MIFNIDRAIEALAQLRLRRATTKAPEWVCRTTGKTHRLIGKTRPTFASQLNVGGHVEIVLVKSGYTAWFMIDTIDHGTKTLTGTLL